MRQKLLIITGATATGKTAIGVHLAKMFGGEILSADSRQVYKGLDCITGKDIEKGQKPIVSGSCIFRGIPRDLVTYTIDGIPVWLYDLVSLKDACSVALYRYAAMSAMDIVCTRRGLLPIVVGGTGLYVSSFTRAIDTLDIPQDTMLRDVLDTETVEALKKRLQGIDNEKFLLMNNSDRNNARRLVRAIEVGEWKLKYKSVQSKKPSFDILSLGIFSDEVSQKERIKQRVVKRVNSCAVREAKRLVGKVDPHMPSYTTLGLSLLFTYLRGDIEKDALIDQWTTAEWAYAKRQETWFRKEKNIIWFDIANPHAVSLIEKLVGEWYTKK